MRGSAITFITIVLLMLTGQSCGEQTGQIPNMPVDFTINVTNTNYIELNAVNGWVYVTGGYKGILVYRSSIDEFMAFERACTFDYEKDCARIEVEESGIIAVDSCCGSRFFMTDGSPLVDGPAKIALKRYQTYFDGEYLHVWN